MDLWMTELLMTEDEFTIFVRATLDFFHVIFENLFNALLIITIGISIIYLLISIYILATKKRKRKYPGFDAKKAPTVTIQIPTYNERAAIQCAKHCLNFDYPKNKVQILIGDDSSDKSISKELDQFAKLHKSITVLRRGNNVGYKAGNLNHMLKHSSGDILVLFDSDFTPGKDFLKRIINPFIVDKSVPAVQAAWKSVNAKQNIISILGSTIISVCHKIVLPFITRRRSFGFLCGSAEAIRKDLLVSLGGWSAGSLTEDIEYSLRLLKNGHRIVYLEDLDCGGEVPHTPKDLYRQQMRWAYGVISSFKQHGKSITFSRKLSGEDKFCTYLDLSGYMISLLLMGLFMTGAISFITDTPGPIDFVKFFSETGRNILLTSGLVIIAIIAQVRSHNGSTIPKVIASFFSYGLVVVYYVNIGIMKAIFRRPMQWFMLNKNANRFST